MLLLAAAHECGSAVFGEPPARVARLHRRVWLLVIQPCNKPSESMTGPAKEREQVSTEREREQDSFSPIMDASMAVGADTVSSKLSERGCVMSASGDRTTHTAFGGVVRVRNKKRGR